ncbi:MAG: preprotein translocase subunit SecG [Flavobacteriales bacterium]|jgi:preprotein translocase subunit SecG|nr:preprotein translocase subunit SecG [Flavobacteriales bacterium]MBQ1968289.1 preprotein translocase subunit SecG [Flavobacteriales bacterium]MBQ5815300.1 preprotein translocase subunit SecG [Flavobacteriales bacterium]MBR4403361.1 preprotein translocase subunit SecG [Flavobacteriales bacterium]
MTFTFFAVIISIVCFFLVVIIMVQNPKGGGLSSTFGGSQQMIGSVRKTNEFLDNATWTLASAIAVLAILSTITLKTSASATYDDLDMMEPSVPLVDPAAIPTPAETVPMTELPATEETAE